MKALVILAVLAFLDAIGWILADKVTRENGSDDDDE